MNTPALESFIFEKMSATRLPGLAIALVKGDDVVYARGFGLADIKSSRGVTERTLFGAASLTKSFVAISILQLAEKGLLKLSDHVECHVSSPIKNKLGAVRIEHLLSHTSGVPALGYIEAVLRHAHSIGGCYLPIASAPDVLGFAQGCEDWAETAPGERWFYLNEGYVLLGEIVAKLTGQNYADYIRQHILQPLGMSRSFFAESDVNGDNDVATPYVLPGDGGPPRAGRYLYNALTADAALITNILDLAKYVSMFLRGGDRILSADAYQAMITPRVALPSGGSYAYGLHVFDDFFGEKLIGHGGSLIVATSYFGFLPQSNIGVAVMSNGNGYGMPGIAKAALATMLGKTPRDLTFVRNEDLTKELAGYYQTFRGTLKIKLTREGDCLRMEYFSGDQPPGPVPLVPESLDDPNEPRFITHVDGARLNVQFHRREGKPTEMIYERYKFRRTGPIL